jgi:cytochrome bd-type quinol oxidase subunit 1
MDIPRAIKNGPQVLALGAALLLLLVLIFGLLPLDLQPSAAFAEETPSVEGATESGYPPAPELSEADYPTIAGVNSRVVVWLVAQLHLWFAAFVLAVPIFVLIIEGLGMATRDERYDRMAYEFIKVSITAYSLTAILGGFLTICLIVFYPHLVQYLAGIFKETMFYYALLFFAESACLYIYYYGWHWLQGGFRKWVHLTVGLLLNAVGTLLMFLANAWLTFMMSPAGVDSAGVFGGDAWAAMHNHLWNPINLHRVIANVAYGGSIVGAYAAYKFLSASSKEEKAHYDWMGYTANFIAISALLPLPFAGYYLAAEIYAYSQQMGITLMGGIFAWLFIIQAVLIGTLFLSANYYLWCGMGRSEGAVRYNGYIKYLALVIVGAFLVWFTPHTLVLTNEELKALGGPYHKYLGPLGIMPAKNTAVNIMILFTTLSFILYRRSNKVATVSWVKAGNAAQVALFSAGILNILFLGTYHGYHPDHHPGQHRHRPIHLPGRARGRSPALGQDAGPLAVRPVPAGRRLHVADGADGVHPLRHPPALARGRNHARQLSIRSGIRQHWHVVGIMRDNSPDAYTPTLGYAANVVSLGTILFMAMVIFVFWLSQVSGAKSTPAGYWKEQKA